MSRGSPNSNRRSTADTLEKQSEERRRRLEAQKSAIDAAYENPVRLSKQRSDDEDDDSDAEFANGAVQNGNVDEKKMKPKKPKKPKVTIADAAAKIDASDLEVFLADVSVGEYERFLKMRGGRRR